MLGIISRSFVIEELKCMAGFSIKAGEELLDEEDSAFVPLSLEELT